MIDSSDFTVETWQTVAFGISMLSLGFWFGTRVAGELAYNEQMSEVADFAIGIQQPDWVGTVQSINRIVLVVFAIAMLGVVVADYYSRDEEERPTLESFGLR